VQAALARYGRHDWTEADNLPLRELFRRHDALQALLDDEDNPLPEV